MSEDKIKCLIIDDEPLVRRSLKRALELSSFQVFEAQDGEQGMKLWQEIKPQVVFLDILMPGLTGPQVLAKIDNDIKRQSRVILISAFTGEYDLQSAKSLGADSFIKKPFEDIFAVVNTVKEMLTFS